MLDRTAMPSRLAIGGNRPPGAIQLAGETMTALGLWLKDNPVISNETECREAKVIRDRVELALKGIEEERDGKVRPLNEEVATINCEYHAYHNTNAMKPGRFDTLLSELKVRINAFFRAEEDRRHAAAEAARRIAAEAEARARQAEEREREAAADAASGICGVDIAEAVIDADAAFATFKKADRIAAEAERDTRVRIGGGFGRTMTLRTKEVLTVADWQAAIGEMGATETIKEAIITSARAYRKMFNELPAGITATQERSI